MHKCIKALLASGAILYMGNASGWNPTEIEVEMDDNCVFHNSICYGSLGKPNMSPNGLPCGEKET